MKNSEAESISLAAYSALKFADWMASSDNLSSRMTSGKRRIVSRPSCVRCTKLSADSLYNHQVCMAGESIDCERTVIGVPLNFTDGQGMHGITVAATTWG